jgi:DNA-binding beta-propeller fold protein YncE
MLRRHQDMTGKIKLAGVILCLFSFFLQGTDSESKLYQKEGIWQDRTSKHIRFTKFEKIVIPFEKAPLKKVKKIALHKNLLYILDGERNEIYVLDKKGKYLKTLGSFGQGPGDIENGTDFFISNDDKIYVLNSIPRRVAVFDLNGQSLDTIRFESPTAWAYPHYILVNPDNSFILGYGLNDLVVINDNKGNFQKSLLKRDQILDEEKANIGIVSQLAFLNNGRKILHFDSFKGIFTSIGKSGNRITKFGAYEDYKYKHVQKIEGNVLKKEKNANFSSTLIFILWTNFCIDGNEYIYTIPLISKKEDYNELYVFSTDGDFLYKKVLEDIKEIQIVEICCDDEAFVFRTHDLVFIIGYKKNRRKS